MRRLSRLLCATLVLVLTAGCGAGNFVPLPVPPTPTAVPTPLPPPPAAENAPEVGGLCGHHGIEVVARFHGHINANDGGHYHGWEGSNGERFWVRC